MPEVIVHKEPTPFFEEVGKAFDAIRTKAFELFDRRGRAAGYELEDWLAAERELFHVPDSEMAETETEFRMTVRVPGFEATDLHVTVEAGQIVVTADIEKFEHGVREVKSMFRRFEVAGVDPAKVTAMIDHDELVIVAPKTVALVAKVPIAIDTPAARSMEASPEKKNGEKEQTVGTVAQSAAA